MAVFKNSVITTQGQQLLAKSAAGSAQVEYTSLRTSNYKYPDDTDYQALTTMEGIQQQIEVGAVTRPSPTQVQINGFFTNESLTSGYYVENFGLYANDPDLGEILFSITPAITADYFPPSSNVASLVVNLLLVVSADAQITITVNPAGTVSQQEFQALANEVAGKAKKNHADPSTDYGAASKVNYGHVIYASENDNADNLMVLPFQQVSESETINLDTYKSIGQYNFINIVSDAVNFPDGMWTGEENSPYLEVRGFGTNTLNVHQTLYKKSTNEIWTRSSTGTTTWNAWEVVGSGSTSIGARAYIDGGSGVNHTLTIPDLTSYDEILNVPIKVINTYDALSGQQTMNINGLGAIALRFPNPINTSLAVSPPWAGWVSTGGTYTLTYNGSEFVVENIVVKRATTLSYGITQLSDSTTALDRNKAATAYAVAQTYQLAQATNTALQRLEYIIDVVPSNSVTLTYNSEVQSPVWINFDEEKLIISGDTSATNPGTYTAMFTPAENYRWEDGTSDPRPVQWNIIETYSENVINNVPFPSGSLMFRNGVSQSPFWNNYDEAKLTMSGDINGIQAKTYTTSFTPNDTYRWWDGTTTEKTVRWNILKRPYTIQFSDNIVILDLESPTKTVTINLPPAPNQTLTYNAQSLDSTIATVTTQDYDRQLVITGVNKGHTRISVSFYDTQDFIINSPSYIDVFVDLPNRILNDNDWKTIREESDSGRASSLWSVGDRKTITLSGIIRSTPVETNIDVFILGFVNSSAFDTIGIHFQCGMFGDLNPTEPTKKMALVDSSYGQEGDSDNFVINANLSNAGGWKDSVMRSYGLGGSEVTSGEIRPIPLNNSYLSCFPDELLDNIKSLKKYTDNTGMGGGANTVTETIEWLTLPAEYEVFGKIERNSANPAEANYQNQYSYYAAGNNKGFYRSNRPDSYCTWWLRSPTIATTGSIANKWAAVSTASGLLDSVNPNISYGIAPIFCV